PSRTSPPRRTRSCGSPRRSWSAGWRGCSTGSRPRCSPSRWPPASSWSRCAAASRRARRPSPARARSPGARASTSDPAPAMALRRRPGSRERLRPHPGAVFHRHPSTGRDGRSPRRYPRLVAQTMTTGDDRAEGATPARPVVADVPGSRSWRRAFGDLRQGWQQRPLWGYLGWQDVKQRYRRSVLGPLWVSISMAVIATAMGILYGALFQMDLPTFLPYVATGLLIWNFVNGCILEGSEVFIANEGLIKFL